MLSVGRLVLSLLPFTSNSFFPTHLNSLRLFNGLKVRQIDSDSLRVATHKYTFKLLVR